MNPNDFQNAEGVFQKSSNISSPSKPDPNFIIPIKPTEDTPLVEAEKDIKPTMVHKNEIELQATKPDLVKPPKSKKEKTKEIVHEAYKTEDHMLSVAQLSEKYGTDLNVEAIPNSRGLTSQKAAELLKLHGKNALTPPKERSEFVKYFSHLLNFLNLLLFGAGILSIATYATATSETINLWLALFLFVLVWFNMTVTYLQERSTSNVMKQFKKMLPPKCKVIRDGKEDEKKADQLVIGDLVKINGGDRIPADIRILLSRGLKVEQSALNGESEEIDIGSESLSTEFMDSRNLIFNGCFCLEGGAIGVVINTGDRTFLGLVAAQTTRTKGEETKFQQEIKGFVRFVFVLGMIMGIVLYAVGVSQGASPSTEFINAFVVMILANVPEGLPATVTSCLTIIAKKMAKQNVFIKKLEAVEALGSASVIASDKTGTLTQNKMSVEHVWFDGNIYTADYLRKFKGDIFKGNKAWKSMLKVACLCNKAFFKEQLEEDKQVLAITSPTKELKLRGMVENAHKIQEKQEINMVRQNSVNMVQAFRQNSGSFKAEAIIFGENNKERMPSFLTDINNDDLLQKIKENNQLEEKKLLDARNRRKGWQIIGDASESALLRFGEDFKNTDQFRSKYEKIFEVPFNSKNKYQISIHEAFEKRFLVMKGAPEMVIKHCTHYMKKNKQNEIDDKFMTSFQKTYEILGSKGERVLGAAYFDLGTDQTHYSLLEKNYKEEGLCFLGLFALMDPPKKGVDDAIFQARKAGIRVMMVTGDHPLTAEAIARTVGIIRDHKTVKEVALKKKIPIDQVNPEEALAAVIYGPDLYKFTVDDWNNVILGKKEIVFSRISPQQKVEIVEHLQRLKEIVIVTGDGVNDAIALKKADIGVAMGEGGSDVAREAADIVFMDGNFASIVNGISEGRKLYDNVKKSLVYTVTHLNVEAMPFILNIGANMPLGLTSLQILSIDLGTELAPAISMAYEYAEDDIMERAPRDTKNDRLCSFRTLSYAYLQASWFEVAFALVAYFAVFLKYSVQGDELVGISNNYFSGTPNDVFTTRSGIVYQSDEQNNILTEAETAYYSTIVMSQFAHIWFCRTRQKSVFSHGFRNAVCNYGVVIELAILIILIYVPALQSPFSTMNQEGKFWTPWIGSLICLFLLNEVRKYWTRKHPKGKVAKWLLW